MKGPNLIYPVLLLAGFSFLISCTDKKKDDPKPIIYIYKLNYDTTYSVSATGEKSPGTGKTIDSTITVAYSDDSVFINNNGYAYQGTDLYFNDPRTQIFFSGTNKAYISITYMYGLGGHGYHTYKGFKQ